MQEQPGRGDVQPLGVVDGEDHRPFAGPVSQRTDGPAYELQRIVGPGLLGEHTGERERHLL